MRRAHKVTRAPELERTRREGKRIRSSTLEVRVVASLHALSRVGLIVPRHKHSAVDRNRLKRRLRELLRLELLPVLRALPQPLDVVVRASAPAYGLPFDALQLELQQLGAQIVRRTRATSSGGDTVTGTTDVR